MKSSPSALSAFLRFFGSIKLAMLLLIVIIVASVVGTFVEARFDASVAQAYVYDSPWFIAWLLLLCVNLVGAVLVRYPWKPHQVGFIITHLGMVVILIGGIIGRIWGVEGNINLVAGERPQNFLVVNETLLQVQQPGKKTESFQLRLNLRRPTEERPFRFSAGDLKVTVLEVADELGVRQVVEPGTTHGAPALRLVMTGEGAPHAIDHWLVKNHRERGQLVLGGDVVRFATERPPAEGSTVSREVHFAFSKANAMNISRLLSGNASGATPEYRFAPGNNGSNDRGTLEIRMAGKSFSFPVQDSINRLIPLAGTEWKLRVLEYLPDFRLENGAPVTVSDQPNNPAVVFELTGPAGKAGDHDSCCPPEAHGHSHGHGVEASSGTNGLSPEAARAFGVLEEADDESCCPTEAHASHDTLLAEAPAPAPAAEDDCCPTEGAGHGASSHGYHAQAASPHGGHHPHHGHGGGTQAGVAAGGNELIIRHDEEGQLVYESRTPEGEQSGTIEVGADFSPGWNGWSFRVEEVLEKAVVREEIGPMRSAGMRRIGASGMLVNLKRNGESVERWLQMGSMALIPLGGEPLHVGFGYRLHPLDFTVDLERFEVEFNPGTETPASFKSHVIFRSQSGEELRRAVWMNNPANFPHFLGAGLLGTSYKFSQSSWNPGDHNQTTLQVIRDPGWSLKWIGSLLFCFGLVTVFYLKPYPRFARNKAGQSADAAEAPEPADQPRRTAREKALVIE